MIKRRFERCILFKQPPGFGSIVHNIVKLIMMMMMMMMMIMMMMMDGMGLPPRNHPTYSGVFFNAEIISCGITQVRRKLETKTLIDVDRSSGKQGFFRRPSRDS